MKKVLLILLLVSAGCTSTPEWWRYESDVDPEALDFYLWTRHEAGNRPDCAAPEFYRKFPVEKTVPVMAEVFRKEQDPAARSLIIGMLAHLHSSNGFRYPVNDSVRSIFQAALKDESKEVREISKEFLDELQKEDTAEQKD